MNNAFVLSELVRKTANIIRIGKVAEIDQNKVRVQIGEVKTGWIPIISTAGKTSMWTPISVGELVPVFAPYGEYAQAFALRSLNYDTFKAPENTDAATFDTDAPVQISGQKECEVSFVNGIKITNQDAMIELSKDGITISNGDASINISSSGISLSFGSSTIGVLRNEKMPIMRL